MRGTYNGWTNYETWLVNLWMDNTEGSQAYFYDLASACIDQTIEAEVIAHVESAQLMFASRLEIDIREEIPNVDLPGVRLSGLFHDLLNSALLSVDWMELAASWVTYERVRDWDIEKSTEQ